MANSNQIWQLSEYFKDSFLRFYEKQWPIKSQLSTVGKERSRGQYCVKQGQPVGQTACAQLCICHSKYSVSWPVSRVSDMGGSWKQPEGYQGHIKQVHKALGNEKVLWLLYWGVILCADNVLEALCYVCGKEIDINKKII